MFGFIRNIAGAAGIQRSSAVPVEMLSDYKSNSPIPVTISGASQVTFTLAASKTKPVRIWNGDDYISIRENKTFTWVAGSNVVLHATTGAVTTETAAAVGVYYMYVGIDSTGALLMYPSTGAPSFVEGPYEGPTLGHPGTARTQFWSYVGFSICDATTPTFIAMSKSGHWYELAKQSVATSTSWALLDYSAVLPKHGVEVGGYLETSASDNDTTEVGASATDGQGAQLLMNSSANLQMAPFSGVVVNSAGKFYGSSTTAAGDVHVTRFKDLV